MQYLQSDERFRKKLPSKKQIKNERGLIVVLKTGHGWASDSHSGEIMQVFHLEIEQEIARRFVIRRNVSGKPFHALLETESPTFF